ncbi:hypothetical protein [Bradyrhizobium sp.]|nr:hypothetical protein [Bradyrhizobium sp.]
MLATFAERRTPRAARINGNSRPTLSILILVDDGWPSRCSG